MRRIKTLLCTGCLLMFITTAGTQAALIKVSERKENQILPGNVSIALTEPDWNPEEENRLFPSETLRKNPQVTNEGTLPVWILLKIEIAKEEIRIVSDTTHLKQEREWTELVRFQTKNGWKLLEVCEEQTGVEYFYGYETLLNPGDTTESLFDEITIVNYLEGELDPEKEICIPIQTYAVQKEAAGKEGSIETAFKMVGGGKTI